jgi:CcmD family protein
MLTFFIAYMAVWLGVLGFVVRLGVKQRQLTRTLAALQAQMHTTEQQISKAA